MLYVHESNFINKIQNDYHNKRDELENFYKNEYVPMKYKIEQYSLDEKDKETFKEFTVTVNDYRKKLSKFARDNGINSQSKLESTFLEELNVYLFEDIDEIKNGSFGIYNKGIYAGLKIDNERKISFITKDVDFCIGKKVNIMVDNTQNEQIIIPIVAVEVKTYMDATMFGEIKSSSKTLRSATPGSQAYVLMGYKSIKDEHIIASRQDATLTEMFCLQENEDDEFHWEVIYEYWKEIKDKVDNISVPDKVNKFGRLLEIERK